MTPRLRPRRRRPIRSRQRGVILGIVLILIAVIFTAGLFALWSTRTDTASAGHDRLSRQLFDCAEQGLAFGKQYFGAAAQRTQWNSYLAASNACSTSGSTRGNLPCKPTGPFPTGGIGNPVASYPSGSPYTTAIQMDTRLGTGVNDFEYTVGIYNDPGDPKADPAIASSWNDANNKVVVYSRCTDLSTLQSRAVQAIITVPMPSSSDYTGQAGRGFRNQGNQNF
jgi:hypothetical protein